MAAEQHLKTCRKCNEEKPHSEFRKSPKGDSFGLHAWCHDCNRAARRMHYQNNKDRYSEWNRSWNESNPEKRERYQADRIRDRGRDRELAKEWRRNNPDRMRALQSNYRSKKRQADGVLTSEAIRLVLDTHGRACLRCGSVENIEIDHVIPLSKGGSNLFENLQPLCKSCNSSKGNRSCADYRVTGGLLPNGK